MNKKLKVTDLAKKYGVSAKEIIKELNGQGVETPDAEKSVIPDDMVELIDSYLADLYDSPEADVPSARGTRKTKGPSKKGNFSENPVSMAECRRCPARHRRAARRKPGGSPASGSDTAYYFNPFF